MAKSKRPNRSQDMDTALFEALKTSVPPKDTGPDPDDILAGLFEEESLGEGQSGNDTRSLLPAKMVFSVELDKAGLDRAQNIVDIIKIEMGKQIDMSDALKIALFCDPLKSEQVIKAFRKIAEPDNRK